MYTPDPRLETEELNDELIRYITGIIIHHVNPLKIYLFGSYAAGSAKKGSDLDFFVLYDGEERNVLIRRKIDLLLWGREFQLDVLVRKPEEVELNFKEENPFYQREIYKKGILLYDRKP